eukprot:7310184-Prymnesium_polylepis.2
MSLAGCCVEACRPLHPADSKDKTSHHVECKAESRRDVPPEPAGLEVTLSQARLPWAQSDSAKGVSRFASGGGGDEARRRLKRRGGRCGPGKGVFSEAVPARKPTPGKTCTNG